MTSPRRRVKRMSFVHNGETWIAEVGERLRGYREVTLRRQAGELTARTRRIDLEDPAIVTEIRSGSPWTVQTDGGVSLGRRSAWENPFMATNRPVSIEYFDDEDGT